jgi:hypothetical protein
MTDQPTTTTDEPTMTTDQRTATEQEAAAQPAAAGQAAAGQAAATERPRTDEQPTGTRELRDAQASGERAATESRARRSPAPATQARPPIRAAAGTPAESAARQNAPLFDEAAGKKLRERWQVIQTEFVDEPRDAVQKADALVAEVLKQLTDTFAREREELEAGWSGSGDDAKREVSTEDLRQAIQRYRSFFNRLLAI